MKDTLPLGGERARGMSLGPERGRHCLWGERGRNIAFGGREIEKKDIAIGVIERETGLRRERAYKE